MYCNHCKVYTVYCTFLSDSTVYIKQNGLQSAHLHFSVKCLQYTQQYTKSWDLPLIDSISFVNWGGEVEVEASVFCVA